MKIRRVGAELFHAAGQPGMTKIIIAFRNFANAPKICKQISVKTKSCITVSAEDSHQTSAHSEKKSHSYTLRSSDPAS
jgi:hypothetical protein